MPQTPPYEDRTEPLKMPLAGLLVADFSRVLAGPLAAAGLADLGATVVKVERPGLGDDTRQWGPPWTSNSSSYFESANRSKRSVELDLGNEGDVALARELARRSDVVIENFRDGALAKYALDYDSIRQTNPRVVYCSITGFGSKAGADLAGYDFLVQAVGGLMSITGEPDGEPLKVGVALVDVLASKDALVGVLAALRSRDGSGTGQRVEINLLSSLLGSLANQASAYVTTGSVPTRMGNAHPSIAPYETISCMDGHLAVCCGNDGQFRRLVQVLGIANLADDQRFATNSNRVQNRTELVDLLAETLARGTVAEWSARLQSVGVPAGRVGDIADAFELAGTLGLSPTVTTHGGSAQVRNPITFSGTPVTHYDAPPRLGEHNEEIRRWLTNTTERELQP